MSRVSAFRLFLFLARRGVRLGDGEPVAALVFGAVERLVGLQHIAGSSNAPWLLNAIRSRRWRRPAGHRCRRRRAPAPSGCARPPSLRSRGLCWSAPRRIRRRPSGRPCRPPRYAPWRVGEHLQRPVADRMTVLVVDRLEMIEIEQQHRGRRAPVPVRRDSAVCSRKPRRLAMPVSASVRAAARWRYSVRSLAMASRMKAIEMVNSSASRLSSSSQPLIASLLPVAAWDDRAERRAQQEQRAMREQHEDRGPSRHQRLVAAAPEFVPVSQL